MFFVGYYHLRDLSDTKIFAYDKLGKRSAIKGPQSKIGLRDYYSEFGKIVKVTHFSVKKFFSYEIISQIAFFLRDDMKIFNHHSTYKKKKKNWVARTLKVVFLCLRSNLRIYYKQNKLNDLVIVVKFAMLIQEWNFP